MQTKSTTRQRELALARLAERQHGVVALRQLDALGFGRGAIKHRMHIGRLHVVHRGVYAVGHPVESDRARWMAAVLVAPGCVLSHGAAAALWRIRKPRPGPVEITCARKREHRDLRFIRAELPDDELATKDGIPVTSPARTLFDLASVLDEHQLRRAFRETAFLRLPSRVAVHTLLHRYPRHRGTAALKEIVTERSSGAGIPETKIEDCFADLVKWAKLPRPRVNEPLIVAGRKLKPDFAWPEQRVIVETDGRESHLTPDAHESDRERDRILSVAGWLVVRITWRQLHTDRERIADDLRRLLAARSQLGSPAAASASAWSRNRRTRTTRPSRTSKA